MNLFVISLAILLLLPGTRTPAQAYYFYDDRHYEGSLLVELGIQGGMMNALTDIGGKPGAGKKGWKDLNLSFSRPCLTVYTSLLYQQSIGLRIHYCTGSITAADSILKKNRSSVQGRYERNLSFQSPVREFAVGIELYPLAFLKNTRMDNTPSRISPYILAGIGFFTFNPQANWEGRWFPLHSLHTEGQGFSMYPEREPYALQQRNTLAGAGVKYEINAWLNGRFEITHRFLKTDYLDDVSLDSYVQPALFDLEFSPAMARLARALADRRAEVDPGHITNPSYQRGNPADKDAYFTVEIGIGIVLGRRRR
jgi:Domain of unknown function (DUF6089)